MPFEEKSKMDQRIRFIAQWSKEPTGFSGLCRAYGISRTTGYKWLDRYEEFGPSGLEDRPPIPKSHPNRVSQELTSLIVQSRKAHPSWGPRKLRAWLMERESGLMLPAVSTMGEILKRHGMIRPRKRRLRVPFVKNPLAQSDGPNDLWCTDFKGNFLHRDRTRNYPLTISDDYSRYFLKCEGLESQKTNPVRHEFELAFEEFGLPQGIRSDNGAPFATTRPGGLSALSIWWIRLGITPERITPGCPQQNGRHERLHKTLKEATASPPKESSVEQQLAFDLFRAEYNEERPHEALGDKTPASQYALSMREYHPSLECSPEYGDEFKAYRVQKKGTIKFKGTRVHLGQLIAFEPVGILQTEENKWEVYYGPVLLGIFTQLEKKKMNFQPVR